MSSAPGVSAPSQTASTGRSAPSAAAAIAAGDLGRARRERADEDRDDGVDRVVGEQDPQRALVLVRGRRGDHVHRVAGRGLGRQPSASRARVAVGERLDAQPRRFAGVGAEDPRAAGVGHDRHAVAPRQRLAREQPRDVEHLAHRLGAHHAGVGEQRVDRDVGGGEQRARCATTAARCARGRAAALDRDDRLVRVIRARDPPEPARVAERLEVEQRRTVVVGVLLPVLEEVVAREVGLVARRDERREPDPARAASSIAAIPNAPLWEANATLPGDGAPGANVALSAVR